MSFRRLFRMFTLEEVGTTKYEVEIGNLEVIEKYGGLISSRLN